MCPTIEGQSTGSPQFNQIEVQSRGSSNVLVKSKLQHPPRAYPGHLTVHRARRGGKLNVALEGWEI